MTDETYTPILDKDLLNIYVISKNGKIKNINTSHIYSQKETNGYMKVKLMNKDGKYKDKTVSRLIGLTYLDIPEDFDEKNYVINHKDGNKLNNHFSNLEWITQKENIHHAYKNNYVKLNNKAVIQYDVNMNFIKRYNSIKDAVLETGCDRASLIKVCKRKQKTSLSFIWKYEIDCDIENKEDDMIDIINFPNYKISKSGKVYSSLTNKFLKPILNKNNHLYVSLCNENGKKNFYIHNLVAEYFLGLKDNSQVIHINKDKKDNRVENLKIINSIMSHKKLSSTNQ